MIYLTYTPFVPHGSRRRNRGGRGAGGQGARRPNNLKGGPTYSLPPPPPPNNSSKFSFNIYLKQEKNHKCTKLKGKIIIRVTLIWFEDTGKTILLNSILEFPVTSDFKMRNVIIWHCFKKNKIMGTWRQNDVDATSLRRIDVATTSCACWGIWPPCPRQYSKHCPPQYSKPSYAYASVWYAQHIPRFVPHGSTVYDMINIYPKTNALPPLKYQFLLYSM